MDECRSAPEVDVPHLERILCRLDPAILLRSLELYVPLVLFLRTSTLEFPYFGDVVRGCEPTSQRLLVWDNVSCQTEFAVFREMAQKYRTFCLHGPGKGTHVWQPLDRGIT